MVSVRGVLAGVVVRAQALQQESGVLRNMEHQSFAIALHVALRLLKWEPANITQSLLIVLK